MWINRKKYEQEKYNDGIRILSLEKQIKIYQTEVNNLKAEIDSIEKLIPYKEQLKSLTYNRLYQIATNEFGMTHQYIQSVCSNKANLIKEVLEAKDELKKI